MRSTVGELDDAELRGVKQILFVVEFFSFTFVKLIKTSDIIVSRHIIHCATWK